MLMLMIVETLGFPMLILTETRLSRARTLRIP